MKQLSVFNAVMLVLALSACDSTDKENDPHAKVNGLAYWITDTAGRDQGEGVVVLDSSQNDGRFSIHWDVDFTGIYHVETIVASGTNLTDMVNVQRQTIFQDDCGPGGSGSILQCGFQASADCTLATDVISCVNPVSNLLLGSTSVSFLSGQSQFIILRACNQAGDDCKAKAIEVTLQ